MKMWKRRLPCLHWAVDGAFAVSFYLFIYMYKFAYINHKNTISWKRFQQYTNDWGR